MISPSNLMKRLGVGGRLVPFFKAVCVYFLVGGGAAGARPPPSLLAAAAKCAPILCLLLIVVLHLRSAACAAPQRWRYGAGIAAGLALSAVGDALLVWPQQFPAGMAAFAGAHGAYLAALGWRPLAPRAALACYPPALASLALLSPPGALRVAVPLYSLLLATMGWRAVARGGLAAAGALLFLLSDALLGYSMFGAGGAGGRLPYDQMLVMVTYYLGQLGIALSVLLPAPAPTPAPTPAPAPAPAAREGSKLKVH